MTLDKFRRKIEEWWAETDARELARKNSQGALLELMELYESFDSGDRVLADQVLGEWVTSENDRKRFDALAMADRFHICSVIPQLRTLEADLLTRRDHEALYELAKVQKILHRLED